MRSMSPLLGTSSDTLLHPRGNSDDFLLPVILFGRPHFCEHAEIVRNSARAVGILPIRRNGVRGCARNCCATIDGCVRRKLSHTAEALRSSRCRFRLVHGSVAGLDAFLLVTSTLWYLTFAIGTC